jgi:hypothetical protein
MNQRATHFNLGSSSQNYGTVYHKDYNPKQGEPNEVKAANPFRSSSLGGGEKGCFATTNKMLYRAWDNVDKAKLDDQKLHELKTHHFKLGSYTPTDVFTTNKIYHDRKPISGEASKNQEESKNKMRAHYHDFKEVALPDSAKLHELPLDLREPVPCEGGRLRGEGGRSARRECDLLREQPAADGDDQQRLLHP